MSEKKKLECVRLTTEEMENVVGGMAAAGSKGGTNLGGPTSGGASGTNYCVCVCACAPVVRD